MAAQVQLRNALDGVLIVALLRVPERGRKSASDVYPELLVHASSSGRSRLPCTSARELRILVAWMVSPSRRSRVVREDSGSDVYVHHSRCAYRDARRLLCTISTPCVRSAPTRPSWILLASALRARARRAADSIVNWKVCRSSRSTPLARSQPPLEHLWPFAGCTIFAAERRCVPASAGVIASLHRAVSDRDCDRLPRSR